MEVKVVGVNEIGDADVGFVSVVMAKVGGEARVRAG